MSRLPIPGQDSGTWGDILNDYLLQAHSSDGTLKPSSVTASQLSPGSVKSTAIQDGSITTAKLANTAITTTKLDSSIQTSLAKADTAIQPADLSTVATTGAYADITGTPTLGTAASLDVGTTPGTVAAGDDTRITGAQSAATLDTDTAALIADPGSATRSGLSSTYVPQPAVAGEAAEVLASDGAGGTVWTAASAPGAHASTHADGGADEIDAADLGSGAATDGHVLTADGAGGAAWEAASGGGASAISDLTDVTTNLFDPSAQTGADIISGYYFGPGGTQYASASYFISTKITVEPSTEYTVTDVTGVSVVAGFWTAGDVWISHATTQTFTTPATAAYLRLNVLTTMAWTTAMLVPGPTLPGSYVPYGSNLPSTVTLGSASLLATNLAYSTSYFSSKEVTTVGTGSAEFVAAAMLTPNTYLGTKQMYATAKAKVLESGCLRIDLIYGTSSLYVVLDSIDSPVAGTDYYLSGQVERTLTTAGAARTVTVLAWYADAATQNGKTLVCSKGSVIDLTAVFGAGTEPRTEDVDLLLGRYTDRWFPGSSDIAGTRALSMMGRGLKPTDAGAYLQIGDHEGVEGGSAINADWEPWGHSQYSYGMNGTYTPVFHLFHGTIETDGMLSVQAKVGRWTKVASPYNYNLFGGHVFQAWNDLGTYRITMMSGMTRREDEACLHVFSPDNAFANPLTTPTAEQAAARITQAAEDQFGPTAYFGRLRIGSDVEDEGYVFQRKKLTAFGEVILADSTVPASATATGTAGQIAWDANYFYVCTATNTWKRTALSTW